MAVTPGCLADEVGLTPSHFSAEVFALGRPEQVQQENANNCFVLPKCSGQVCGFLPEWFMV